MSDFSNILEHPDSEEIVARLLKRGESPRQVNQWLKLKYPDKDQGHLRLTIKCLKDFSTSQYTDCYTQFAKDLTTHKTGGKINRKVADSLLNNKTYQERLNEVAEKEVEIVDIKQMMQSLIFASYERMEQVFDRIQEDPRNFKGDRIFLEYLEKIFNMFEKHEKLLNSAPDQIIQHNITLQAVESNTNAILEAIRETLAQMDSEASLLFMDLFYSKLKNLNAPPTDDMSHDDRVKDAKVLREKIIDAKADDDS